MEHKKEKAKALRSIVLMIVASIFTAFGQLFWKLFQAQGILFLFLGFVLYGLGAIAMILAFKSGELSVLYPIMCTGYIVALVNGKVFLNETIGMVQGIGIVIIMIGIIFMGIGGKK